MPKKDPESTALVELLREADMHQFILTDKKTGLRINYEALLPHLIEQANADTRLLADQNDRLEAFTNLTGEFTPPTPVELLPHLVQWRQTQLLQAFFGESQDALYFNYFAACPALVEQLSQADQTFGEELGANIETALSEEVDESSLTQQEETVTEDGNSSTDTAPAPKNDYVPVTREALSAGLEKSREFNEYTNRDRKALQQFRDNFAPWRSLLGRLTELLENELIYELFERLEESTCNLEKRKQVLTFPLHLENKSKENQKLIDELAHVLQAVENKGSAAALLAHGRINVRTATTFDYSLVLENGRSEEYLRQEKETLNSLLLVLRMLERGKGELPGLLIKLNGTERMLANQLIELNKGALLHSLLCEQPQEAEQQLAAMDGHLKENTRLLAEVEAATDSTIRAAIKYLNRLLLDPFNQLLQLRYNLESLSDTETAPWTRCWIDLLTAQETEVFEPFLHKLNITRIPVKRGDAFDYTIHSPISEAEPDPELPKDAIKSIEGQGFWLELENREPIVLKTADVIVA